MITLINTWSDNTTLLRISLGKKTILSQYVSSYRSYVTYVSREPLHERLLQVSKVLMCSTYMVNANIHRNWLIISKYTAKHIWQFFNPVLATWTGGPRQNYILWNLSIDMRRTEPILSIHFSLRFIFTFILYNRMASLWIHMCHALLRPTQRILQGVTQTYRLGMFSIFQPARQRFLNCSSTVP